MKKYTFIDLFAGAGGLSEGFTNAGFDAIAHVEMDPKACETLLTRQAYHLLKDQGEEGLKIYHKYLDGKLTRQELYRLTPNFIERRVINKAISQDTVDEIFVKIRNLMRIPKIDLIVGGPPCQAYSLAGRSRKGKAAMESDTRSNLYLEYVRFLKEFKPKMFVFENVIGILSFKNGTMIETLKQAFEEAGYEIDYKRLLASDYNVLQDRRRVIIVGWQKELGLNYPAFPKAYPKNSVTINDLLMDLPKLMAGQGEIFGSEYVLPDSKKKYQHSLFQKLRENSPVLTWHVARPHTQKDQSIYKLYIETWNKEKRRIQYNELSEELKTHRNQTAFLDRFKVVASDLQTSQTIVAHICKDGHYYIHPDLNQSRSLSVREAARLQSFADNYFFEGSRTAVLKQIGNAVPPLLAEVIAESVRNELDKLAGDLSYVKLPTRRSVGEESLNRFKSLVND